MYSFVPSAGIVKAGSAWIHVDPPLLALLERVTADLEPFPRPELTRVLVGGRPTADPSVY